MIRKPSKKTSMKAGLPPGTLVHIGEKKAEAVKIRLLRYSEDRFEERELTSIDEGMPLCDKPGVNWIHVMGIHDVTIVRQIGTAFGMHSLLLEDVLHTHQRPKLEDFGDYLFMVLKSLHYDQAKNDILVEQVSLILGSNFVVSFQESDQDMFNPVRERIRGAKGRIRRMQSDYLVYALADTIVDHYFPILELLGERTESLQEDVLAHPTPETLEAIQKIRREMILVRRSVWPLREAVSHLERIQSPLVSDKVHLYLRDIYDHTVQVIENVESLRDIVSAVFDLYLSSLSNRMNRVMKVLTIIATVFIPPTFIAGVYGMNFKHMPELDWPWAYPASLLLMFAVGIAMLVALIRKDRL